ADASLDITHPLAEPAAELAVGLVPEPQPGELDRKRAGARVAGFADALLAAALPAVIGQPAVAAHLAAVVERAVERFVDQLLAANHADAPEVDKLNHLGGCRPGHGGTQFGFARRFQGRDLLLSQTQTLVLAHDLLLQQRRQRTPVAGAHRLEA